MKKILSIALSLIMLFLICSCGSSNSNQPDQNNGSNDNNSSSTNITTSCNHSWKNATCTDPSICSKCGKTNGSSLGHTTSTGICSRCGENFSGWETGEYTDEFDTPTGNKYMGADCYGTFSNSATTNSDLYAYVQIDKNNIGIMLFEYNRNLVKGTFDYENYDITILDEQGYKHYYTGVLYKSSTRIYFYNEDEAEIISLLKNNDTLKIYLKSTKYSISTYLFTLNSKGFSDIYRSINQGNIV